MGKIYQYCKIQKKVVPIEEVMIEVSKQAFHSFTSDDMKPTRSPITGKYYTSKSKLRAEYRAFGAEEVGTAYENGYDPSYKLRDETKEFEKKLHEKFKEHLNN